MGKMLNFLNNLGKKKEKPEKEDEIPQKKKEKDWLLTSKEKKEETRLDKEISSFLEAYYEKINLYGPRHFSGLAYSALVELGASPATEQELIDNAKNEKKLLKRLVEKSFHIGYNFQIQGLAENPAFFHIQIDKLQFQDKNKLRRIYITCNNGNVAKLAEKLLQYNCNDNFYLKFCSNSSIKRHSRNEKIVIYCQPKELDYINQLLNYTEQKHPELFKESKKVLPFLKRFNHITSFAKTPSKDRFINLNGEHLRYGESANSLISEILRDSYQEAFLEIARRDKKLSEEKLSMMANGTYSIEKISAKNIPYVLSEYKTYLLESMKAKMQILSAKNNFEIAGIHSNLRGDSTSKQKQSKKHTRD